MLAIHGAEVNLAIYQTSENRNAASGPVVSAVVWQRMTTIISEASLVLQVTIPLLRPTYSFGSISRLLCEFHLDALDVCQVRCPLLTTY